MKSKLALGLCFIIIALQVMLSGCGSSSSPPSVISPDIAFISNRDIGFMSPYSRIWSMKPDGTITQLTDVTGKFESYPAFSKDRTKLAFISNRDGADAIYIANANGTSPQKLDLPGFAPERIALSPDGTKIAFHSYNRLDTTAWKIYICPIGGSPVRLTSGSGYGNEQCPNWSVDGAYIYFMNSSEDEIYKTNASDQTTQNMTNSPDTVNERFNTLSS